MLMGIKEEIIEALEALNPQIDRGKALLELDESALVIARLLKEPMGLALAEYISKDLEYGKYPIYSMNKFLDKVLCCIILRNIDNKNPKCVKERSSYFFCGLEKYDFKRLD